MLVVQNSSLILLMKYSRMTKKSQLYATTSAVFCMEIVKFFTCFLFLLVEKRGNLNEYCSELYDEIIGKKKELFKIFVPALLFTIQNNLLYYAISQLDVVTFQATSQLKILTTALFSVLMLNKTVTLRQWFACILLGLGVSLTQISSVSNPSGTHSSVSSQTGVMNPEDVLWNIDYKLVSGFAAVLCACLTSGFSSVYFEKILKNDNTSLWIRNIQMSLFSVIIAYIGMIFSAEYETIQINGIFHGYNEIVCSVILLQAIGGLIVAVVMKYTDNIVKGFATSFSIGISWLISAFFFQYQTTVTGFSGLFLIMFAVCLYTMPAKCDTSASSNVLPLITEEELNDQYRLQPFISKSKGESKDNV
jgi:UDP-sugar transporter A1/2/3